MKRYITTIVSAVVLAGLMPAQAVANPGSSGYWAKQCSVATGARLSATNYYSSHGQTYHLDLNSGSGWYPVAIYFNGTRLSGWNDVYVHRSVKNSVNTIKGQWKYNGYSVYSTCTVTG